VLGATCDVLGCDVPRATCDVLVRRATCDVLVRRATCHVLLLPQVALDREDSCRTGAGQAPLENRAQAIVRALERGPVTLGDLQ
jgi:hypothetical protein